ncbi:hypothetical protein J6590_087523 [Homalodisca vitripennis]|nr:hypothetical protein J6590_087523 [Homalodisca vitripennis]
MLRLNNGVQLPVIIRRYSNDKSLKWHCNRVDCSNAGRAPASSTGILEDMDSLATKADIESISNDIASLKNDLEKLSKVILDFEPRLCKVEVDVKHLLEDAQTRKHTPTVSVDEVYSEMVDCTARQSNITIFNAPESQSPQVSVKKTYDLEPIKNILTAANVSIDKFTFYRIGKS